MTEYKSNRFMDGKVRQVIVDETGKIVNRNPSKEELKGLEIEQYDKRNESKKYNPEHTDEDLLSFLMLFYEENGRIPKQKDFDKNPGYPSYGTYVKHFGNWNSALKLVGMDIDTRVMQGCLKTEIEKARYTEIKVINHFKQHPIDLAGKDCHSHCDGICPNGKTYDVKSSKLYVEGYYKFSIKNKYKEEIEIYYFLAFNEDYSKLECVWRVPGEIVEKDYFIVGSSHRAEFNVENMKEYDITYKFKEIIE